VVSLGSIASLQTTRVTKTCERIKDGSGGINNILLLYVLEW